jgi:probable F420-dependent oxidoreductase
MPDHCWDQLAPVPALMAAAQATTRLRIGSLVFANDYKHPAVLAKEAATLDFLSGGRLELGLGAGWMTADYDALGLQYDSPGVRIERLEEGVAIVKAFFTSDPVTFEGRHYQVRNLMARPRPVQQPHPPIMIGGGGRKMLSLAGRLADIVGINVDLRSGDMAKVSKDNLGEAATREKIDWVKAAAGNRFQDIELQVSAYQVAIDSDGDAARAEAAAKFGVTPAEVDTVPHVLAGTLDEVVACLQRRRETFGFSYVVVAGEYMRPFAPVVERLSGR